MGNRAKVEFHCNGAHGFSQVTRVSKEAREGHKLCLSGRGRVSSHSDGIKMCQTCGQKCSNLRIIVSSSAPLQLSPLASPIICISSTTTRPISSCLPWDTACVIKAVAFSNLVENVSNRGLETRKRAGRGGRRRGWRETGYVQMRTHVHTHSVGRCWEGSWGKGESPSCDSTHKPADDTMPSYVCTFSCTADW